MILISSAALISACGESELKKEVIELRRDAAERRAELEYLERQASIAAGCDFMIQICPDSVTKPGRAAQQSGLGGGSDWPFWLAVVGKMAALGAAVGSMISAARLVWVRFGQPSAAEIESARQMIRDSHVAQARSESLKKAHEARLVERRDEIKHAADELDKLQRETAAAEQLLQRHQKEIEAVKSAKAALAAFH